MKENAPSSLESFAPDETVLAILEYVAGRMSPDEMIVMELRLSEEPALAAALESFDTIESLAEMYRRRQVAADEEPGQTIFRFPRGGKRLGLVAAGAVILVLMGDRFGGWFDEEIPPSKPGERLRVAILGTGSTVNRFNEALEVPPDRALEYPISWRRQKHSGEELPPPEEISNREYLEYIDPILAERVNLALEGEVAPAPAERFLLPVVVEQPLSLLVLVIDAKGETWGLEGSSFGVAWPGDPPWNEASGRLEIGSTLLPGDPLQELERVGDGTEEVSFRGGFVVPMGTEASTVLVASRPEPLGRWVGESMEELLERCRDTEPEPRNTVEELRGWLKDRGFEVEELFIQSRE